MTRCLKIVQLGDNLPNPLISSNVSSNRENLSDRIRTTMEHCDSLQSFLMLHSLGGGTGSGLGSYILELLEDEFPEVYRFSMPVFPSQDDDVVTSPYNALLSLNCLSNHADCVLPIENQVRSSSVVSFSFFFPLYADEVQCVKGRSSRREIRKDSSQAEVCSSHTFTLIKLDSQILHYFEIPPPPPLGSDGHLQPHPGPGIPDPHTSGQHDRRGGDEIRETV